CRDQVADRHTEQRPQERVAFLDGRAERLRRGKELATHTRPLRALTGEQEADARRALEVGFAKEQARDVAGYAALDATEGGDELVAVTRNDCSALLPVGAAAPERACDVAHCQLRMRCHVVGESTRELTKRFRRACREWHDRVLDVDGRSGGLSFLGRCTL